MDVFLETERLLLRRFTEDDVDNLVALDADPAVMRYINGGRPTPRAAIERDFLPAFLGYYGRYAGYGFWAAIEKVTGDFLGWFHFRPGPGDPRDEPELGYRLRASAWGRGYATEGARALIDKGFAEFGVRRVFATTMTVNRGSRRVLEKCGLTFVRTFTLDWPEVIEGSEHGDVEYALTRDEWSRRRTVADPTASANPRRGGGKVAVPLADDPSTEHPTTRAVVLERFDAPVVVRGFPIPPPSAGSILVRTRYGGVCGTDVHLRHGYLGVPTPLVLGHEGFGTIAALGAGVAADANGAELRQGDEVMWASSIACGTCVPCRVHGEPTLCENRRTYGVNVPADPGRAPAGSWSAHMELRAGTTVVLVPAGVDSLAAISLACAGPTMLHAVHGRRPVRPGEVVVVQGSGPVGLAAAAVAQLAGAATVIVLGGPAGRLDLASAAGIGDHHLDIVGADDQDAVLARAVELTGGRGADLVIECTGVPGVLAQGFGLARRGGSYLVVGQYTDRGPTPLNPHQIVHRQLDVVGSFGFAGAHLVEYVRLLPVLCGRFDLASLVTTYPLADAEHAMADVAAGAIMKAVLDCA